MPRQAVRLVLGRGAKAPTTTRLRPFSTTPKRCDDASKPTTRRDRSVAAASAIGALGRSSQPSQRPEGSSPASKRSPIGAQRPKTLPSGAALGARLGANVISVRSLPKRQEGDNSKPIIRRVSFNRDGTEGPAGYQRPRTGPAGDNVLRGRFTPGPNGPRFARPPSFQGRPGFGPAARAGGGKRPPTKRAGGVRKGKKDDDKKKEREEGKLSGLKSLDAEVQAYVREQQVGTETAYKPSVTLSSLVGWGPAVATNTALGQADMAFRSVKTLGGGRGASEVEQSFKIDDVKKWLVANKPIYFSNVEQKRAVIETLSHEKRNKLVEKYMHAIVKGIQKENGNNWGAFVGSLKAWAAKLASSNKGKKLGQHLIKRNARPEDWLRAAAEARANAKLEDLATKYKTQNTKNTKEAIHKFVLKGEHPEAKYAEDVYGKLATYHAKGSTYTIADGAKFDEKIRTLVKVAPAAKAAPSAKATA